MSQVIKEKIERLIQKAYNEGNADCVADIVSPDYVRHQSPMKDVKGVDGYKTFIRDVRSAYSGFEIKIDELIIDGDKSVFRHTIMGKHTGQAPTLQAAPTGSQIEMPACSVAHWKDGKIVEEWVYNDYLGLMQQFGVVPLPGLFA